MPLSADVIVIGGGINGLTAGAYLARAGLKTLVVERRHMVGAHCSAEELTIPGVRHNLHASAIVTPLSPCIEDLDLERHGLELMGGEWALFHPFLDGKSFLAHSYDINVTYRMIRTFSERDAARFKEFVNGFYSRVPIADFLRYTYTPPSLEEEEKMNKILSTVPGIPGDMSDMNGYDFMDYMFEDDQLKTALVGFQLAAGPAAITKGTGAQTALRSLLMTAVGRGVFGVRGGSSNLPWSLANCILSHGGMILENCPVERIIVRDGVAEGIELTEDSSSKEKVLLARRAVVSNLTAVPTFLRLVGEEHLDSSAVSALKKFDYNRQQLYTVAYATEDVIRWKAQERNPAVMDAYWFHYGAESMKELLDHERDLEGGRVTYPIVAVGGSFVFTTRDRSQAPIGCHNVTTWVDAPYNLKDKGAEGWDDITHEVCAKVTERIEEYAPGFRRSVLRSFPYSPLDIVRRNPSALEGNFCGGNPRPGQSYLDRPFPGCGAPRTPIRNLYLSNSIFPQSSTALATGYIAACVVAGDLGVRRQAWWSHEPLGWFRNWVATRTGRPWSPLVTAG